MSFAFRHQPLKAIYLTGSAILLLFIRLPFWTVASIIPAWRPRRSWTLGRILMVNVLRSYINILYDTELMSAHPIEQYAADAENTGFVWVDPTPELVIGEIKQMAEHNQVEAVKTGGFWYGPRSPNGAVGQKALKNEKVIYHMHGGGFVMGTGAPSSGPMKTCLDGLLEHSSVHDRLFALEYRLASAAPFPALNPFPACLLDALAGYRYLVQDVGFDPENIVISGDSAGGLLAIALAYYLATHSSELPDNLRNAGGLLLLSPTVDWAVSDGAGPQTSMRRHARSDFVEAILMTGYTRRALLGNLPEETAATSIYISPGSLSLPVMPGMFAGLPRTCIVAGGAEQTLDPIRVLKDRIAKDLGDLVLWIEPPDATHDFLTASWHEPERTNTLKEIGAWLAGL